MNVWTKRETLPETVEKELAEYSDLVRNLLFARGIATKEEAEIFLHPSYERDMLDPFLLRNMEKAVERILEAIKKEETIFIYADYDCDGIPGSVVLHDFFVKIGFTNFEVYIPHRYKEGYGLNKGAVDYMKEAGASLVITVDNGITNNDEVAYAQGHGIDVIVTDHHLPGDTLPPAYAVVNPNQEGCDYPNKGLCGGGVAFKLVQALLEKEQFGIEQTGWEKWMLDVAGVSTIADMVPLTGENRAIAHFGLTVLRRTNRPGILKLLKSKGVSQPSLTEEDVGFVIAPHVNAASRMGIPKNAFNLLATRDAIEAHEEAQHLSSLNNKRKRAVEQLCNDIEELLGDSVQEEVIFLGKREWQPGLLGLIANRIAEKHDKPVCLWGSEGSDVARGSCRGNGQVNIVDLMSAVPDGVFIDYGGHVHSGGFSFEEEKEAELKEMFQEVVRTMETKENIKDLVIDEVLTLEDVNWNTYKEIEQLSPYGIGNEKPLFLFEAIEVLKAEWFGATKHHLKLLFKKRNSEWVEAIQFFAGNELREKNIVRGDLIDLVAHIEKNSFRQKNSLRLRIVDIRKAVL